MTRSPLWPSDWSDPVLWLAGALVLALLVAIRAARAAAGVARGQERLAGGFAAVAEAQAAAQARLAEGMERRLDEMSRQLGETVSGSTARTAGALGALQARLGAIDAAQGRIEKLSGDVLGLQDILSNKQARGLFGEVQLAEILRMALPPDAYRLQATLSTGRRADCLVLLPDPPGPIAIDAKFPLEAWEALRAATTDIGKERAARAFRQAVSGHVRDIAERYILPGETAESALMFLPSEAVYAELHANFGDVVRAGFSARVWIVSPTTMMALLTTMRGVMRDGRIRAEAGRIRRELGLLVADLGRLDERVGRLDQHLRQADDDVAAIRLSAEKAGRRAARLEAVEFGDEVPEERPQAARI